MISKFTVRIYINVLTSTAELEVELDRRQRKELRSLELTKAFEKPKATEYELRHVEKGIGV